MMMKKLVFNHAVITGGSSGIGLSLAKKLVQSGSDLLIIARGRERLDSAARALRELTVRQGQAVRALSLDVSLNGGNREIMRDYFETKGAPDLLINSAGIARPGCFENISDENVRTTMDINVLGAWNMLQAVVPYMKANGRGHIVNVSSIAGFLGLFGYSAYSASKFAVIGLSESLRNELKPEGISVHVLCPPDTDTPQLAEEEKTKPKETKVITSNTRVYHPDEVADACLKGIRRGSFMILPGGKNKLIYFMKRIFPSIVYAILDGDVKKARNHE